MSQGFIGYHLQQALQQEFLEEGISRTVVSVVTQVLVDQQDPAFQEYTKPIGGFYTKEEAEVIEKENGYRFVEDSGRGYRRVVPSPSPQRIIELSAIRRMVQSSQDNQHVCFQFLCKFRARLILVNHRIYSL